MTKAATVFISYAHIDEQYKDALYEHLSSLRRNGEITVWHDRKINPGQDWKTEISGNLENSSVILFLVSSSFINSEYCYGIEWRRALELKEAGSAVLIPIVVRPCDWHDTPIAQLQGLPKDGRAVELWENKDSAWLDVVSGIKKILKEFSPSDRQQLCFPLKPAVDFEVHSKALLWIDDTEVVLSHRKVDKVSLGNIYVSLDLEGQRISKRDEIIIKNSDLLFSKAGRYVVSGEEQQGKTTLLKRAFRQLGLKAIISVFLQSECLNSGWPSGLPDDCFPGPRRGLNDGCHALSITLELCLLYRNCTDVPTRN